MTSICFLRGTTWCGTVLIVMVLAGCGEGIVAVGTPQVFTRERLVQERVEEETWLKNQLQKTPNEVSFQGIRDIRDFSGLYQELQVTVDPAQAELFRLDHNIDKAKKELDLAKARYQLDWYRQSEGKESQSASKETAPTATSGAKATTDAPIAFTGKKIPDKTDELRSGTLAKKTEAHTGVLDLLHDQLAFRNTVNAARRERQLDDAHDLAGSTIYDFQFDVTVKPDGEQNKYAEVMLWLSNPYCPAVPEGSCGKDRPSPQTPTNADAVSPAASDSTGRKVQTSSQTPPNAAQGPSSGPPTIGPYFEELYRSWSAAYEKILNTRIFEIQKAYLNGQLSESEREWLVKTITVDLPNLRQLFVDMGKTIPAGGLSKKEEMKSSAHRCFNGQHEETASEGTDCRNAAGVGLSLQPVFKEELEKLHDPSSAEDIKEQRKVINQYTVGVLRKAAHEYKNMLLMKAIPIFQDMVDLSNEYYSAPTLIEVVANVKEMAPVLDGLITSFGR